jgi:predicted small lipoprotein YifL
MIIITKKTRLKTNFTRLMQLGSLLLFLAAVTGCGNKGDLYHPSEEPNSQAVSSSAADRNEQNNVSL